MKILVIANHSMGLYNFRKELLESLVKNNHEIYVSLPIDKMKTKFEEIGCNVVNTKLDRRGTNIITDLKLLFKYTKMIKRINPGVVLTYTIKPNIYGGIACQLTNKPYMTNITGLGSSINYKSLLQKIILNLYKIGLRKSNCIFFQNRSNLEFFNKNKLIKTRRKLIPGSGVNTKEYSYKEYPPNGNIIRFLYVGRIMKDKGIDELLEVAERINGNYKNVEFHLVGFHEEEYHANLDKLHKQEIINFHGRQSNVQEYYQMCHALVHPSYHEGMSNVMLEAASSGRPVIASEIPGCQEIFDEKITGFGFKPKNKDSLYEALVKFIELPYKEKKSMGKAGREKVVNEFDRDIVVKEYMNEINQIVEEN